jgi:hypothetical protein
VIDVSAKIDSAARALLGAFTDPRQELARLNERFRQQSAEYQAVARSAPPPRGKTAEEAATEPFFRPFPASRDVAPTTPTFDQEQDTISAQSEVDPESATSLALADPLRAPATRAQTPTALARDRTGPAGSAATNQPLSPKHEAWLAKEKPSPRQPGEVLVRRESGRRASEQRAVVKSATNEDQIDGAKSPPGQSSAHLVAPRGVQISWGWLAVIGAILVTVGVLIGILLRLLAE